MEIRKVPVGLLNPAPYNPRRDLQPEDSEYQALKNSMDEFGYVAPIIWNERTGNVVHGHQRLKILIESGETEVEVSVVNLGDMREKGLNIALNKISGDWDEEKLTAVLAELAADADEMLLGLTGFQPEELDHMLNGIQLDDFFNQEPKAASTAATKERAKTLERVTCPNCGEVFAL